MRESHAITIARLLNISVEELRTDHKHWCLRVTVERLERLTPGCELFEEQLALIIALTTDA
jgi:hypothetical protein